VANAATRGEQLLEGLRGLAARYPVVGDARGIGLMAALEIVTPDVGDGRVPDGALAKGVLRAALERRLMLLSAGPYGNVVRIIPPLVTTADEIDLALGILDEALADAVS
jgi:4-aminobutyrate aminotransferase